MLYREPTDVSLMMSIEAGGMRERVFHWRAASGWATVPAQLPIRLIPIAGA